MAPEGNLKNLKTDYGQLYKGQEVFIGFSLSKKLYTDMIIYIGYIGFSCFIKFPFTTHSRTRALTQLFF